jgi:hypothetical protein
VERDNRQAA